MQELPEIDVYRQLLADRISGKEITDFELSSSASLVDEWQPHIRELQGKIVYFVERRGKHLLLHLDNGKRLVLYLVASSYLYWAPVHEETDKLAQFKIHFGSYVLHLVGVRPQDIHLLTVRETEVLLSKSGLDPLHKATTLPLFIQQFARKRSPILQLLAGGNVISGVGTVYAQQIIDKAGLTAEITAKELTQEQWADLLEAVQTVLQKAIEAGGMGKQSFAAEDDLTGGFARQQDDTAVQTEGA